MMIMIYVYMYMHTIHTYVCIYIYIYAYVSRARGQGEALGRLPSYVLLVQNSVVFLVVFQRCLSRSLSA